MIEEIELPGVGRAIWWVTIMKVVLARIIIVMFGPRTGLAAGQVR